MGCVTQLVAADRSAGQTLSCSHEQGLTCFHRSKENSCHCGQITEEGFPEQKSCCPKVICASGAVPNAQFITPISFVGLILALDRTAFQYLLFKDPDTACQCPGGQRACTGLGVPCSAYGQKQNGDQCPGSFFNHLIMASSKMVSLH